MPCLYPASRAEDTWPFLCNGYSLLLPFGFPAVRQEHGYIQIGNHQRSSAYSCAALRLALVRICRLAISSYIYYTKYFNCIDATEKGNIALFILALNDEVFRAFGIG